MNLPLFLAKRMYKGEETDKNASRPAVLIAMTGIAIGLAVMIITVAIIVGFKQEIRNKIVGFSGHAQVSNLHSPNSFESLPIMADDDLLSRISEHSQVSHLQRYATKVGMIKTDDAFQGMVLKGVGQEYDLSFLKTFLLAGEMPQFTDSVSSNQVLISKTIADKMQLAVGDKMDTYFVQENIRARRLTIAGIYQTNFSAFDNQFLITDLHLVNRLNGWEKGQVSGIEVMLHDYDQLGEASYILSDSFYNVTDSYGQSLCVRNVEQINSHIFGWLEVLDVNIWVILVLMIGISGFTMISGLLIIIIERTSMIGVLKSLGANNATIRHQFLWFAVFLVGKGMFWGNVVGLGFYAIQHWFHLFPLDPANYYMDCVPVSLSLWHILLLNGGTLLASVLILILPSYLITRIHPATSMRYE